MTDKPYSFGVLGPLVVGHGSAANPYKGTVDTGQFKLVTNDERKAVDLLTRLYHATLTETGFAAAVRRDSNTAYPWPAFDLIQTEIEKFLNDQGVVLDSKIVAGDIVSTDVEGDDHIVDGSICSTLEDDDTPELEKVIHSLESQ